jgi:sugar phosphate isomerase/epimerase
VNDPALVACLDLGHAEMKGSGDGAPAMIRALGHHLQALHVHDNDCLHDSHQLPFSMNMDFNAIARALKEIGYSGYITLEADNYLKAYNADNLLEGAKKMAEVARRIADMVEA